MSVNLSNITISGPFWKAQASIVEELSPFPTEPIILLKDDFNTYELDDNPRGWRDTQEDFSLEEDDALFKIRSLEDDLVFRTSQQKDNIHSHYDVTGAKGWKNYIYQARLRFNNVGSGIGLTFLSQYGPESEFRYYFIGREGSGSRFTLQASPNLGTNFGGTIDSGVVGQINEWYHLRIEVEDTGTQTNVRAKIWKDADGIDMPDDYQIDAFDTGPDRLISGTVGLRTSKRGTKYFNDISVVGIGALNFSYLRRVFVDHPDTITTLDVKRLPTIGTAIAICKVSAVEVQLPSDTAPPLSWSRKALEPEVATVREGIRTGQYSLLVLRSVTDEFQESPGFMCLNGYVNLNWFDPIDNAKVQLYNLLSIAEQDPGNRSGTANLPGTISLHSSGMSVFGTVELPWMTGGQRFAASFQLTQLFPDLSYHLTIEEQRLKQDERRAWIAALQQLSQIINPLYPENEISVDPNEVPNWATFELTNISEVPQLYWVFLPTEAAFTRRIFFRKGAVNIYLSDQQLYNESRPPTSAVQLVPRDVELMIGEEGDIILGLSAAEESVTVDAKIVYTAKREEAEWSERVVASEVALGYDAVGIAQTLRNSQELSEPLWSKQDKLEDQEPIAQPVVWGFLPLEEGWAQLPIINLNEQIYLDAKLADQDALSQLKLKEDFRGAVSYGNQLLLERNGRQSDLEQSWNINIINARGVEGQWTLALDPDTNSYQMKSASLSLFRPDLIMNGFYWLSTGKPEATDALPNLDNWISGLFSVPLRTYFVGESLYPPLLTLQLDNLEFSPSISVMAEDELETIAKIEGWELTHQVNQAQWQKFIDQRVIPTDTLSRALPLLWLRHPTLPMIQALPLTQSQRPPNYPAASRQLVPFQLALKEENGIAVPDDWKFGVESGNGAAQWAYFLGNYTAAQEWADEFDLPLVSLSLPGAILAPQAVVEHGFLALQLRLDLPYLDEINALAQLPKIPQDPDTITPLPIDEVLEPPLPLYRADYAEHWQSLSNLANLSNADAVDAFREVDDEVEVIHLIEPYKWPIELEIDLESYPGRLTIRNRADFDGETIELSGLSALRGIRANFEVDEEGKLLLSSETVNPFRIEANSMQAHLLQDANRIRDQRGLSRGRTSQLDGLIQTPLLQEQTITDSKEILLTSTTEPVKLELAGGGQWEFWCKDVPIEDSAEQKFIRSEVRSASAAGKDVNDPQALSRTYNYLQGYEWRLSAAEREVEQAFLYLFDLHFYPLTLEEVELGTGIKGLKIRGRLQLPIIGFTEQEHYSNAVELSFVEKEGILSLAEIEIVADKLEWPLGPVDGSTAEVPFLTVQQLNDSGDNAIQVIDKDGTATLQFSNVEANLFLFDAAWQVKLKSFNLVEPETTNPTPIQAGEGISVFADSVSVSLDVDRSTGLYNHSLEFLLKTRLGNRARLAFKADICFHLAGDKAGEVTLLKGSLFEDLGLPLANAAIPSVIHYFDKSIQVHWKNLVWNGLIELLPGMEIVQAEEGKGSPSPGFVALSFSVPDTVNPVLELQTAFVESLLLCSWGTFLQSTAAIGIEKVFESSAGELTFGFTTQFTAGQWSESYLLNGYLEVVNLISWPGSLSVDTQSGQMQIPQFDSPDEVALSHWRHCVKAFLNQHELAPEVLVAKPGGQLLFTLSEELSWQVLVVMEHQLAQVDSEKTIILNPDAISNIRRWTTVQELRLVHPQKFKNFIGFLNGGNAPGALYMDSEAYEGPSLEVPDGAALIRGRVVNSLGRGLPNAKVELWRTISGAPSPTGDDVQSNASGYFAFFFHRRISRRPTFSKSLLVEVSC